MRIKMKTAKNEHKNRTQQGEKREHHDHHRYTEGGDFQEKPQGRILAKQVIKQLKKRGEQSFSDLVLNLDLQPSLLFKTLKRLENKGLIYKDKSACHGEKHAHSSKKELRAKPCDHCIKREKHFHREHSPQDYRVKRVVQKNWLKGNSIRFGLVAA